MKIENETVIKVTKNDRLYTFTLHPESTLGEVHDVLCDMKSYVVRLIVEQEARDRDKLQEPEGEIRDTENI